MAKRKMNPNSLKNLEKGKATQFKSGDPVAKQIASKGGKKSQEVQRQKTNFKELFELYLSLPDEETGEVNDIAMAVALFKKAKAGDTKAFEIIRDTIGQKPVERQEVIGGDLSIVVNTKKD